MARKPSHFGSKRKGPSGGMASTSLASIGSMGGESTAHRSAGEILSLAWPPCLSDIVPCTGGVDEEHRIRAPGLSREDDRAGRRSAGSGRCLLAAGRGCGGGSGHEDQL